MIYTYYRNEGEAARETAAYVKGAFGDSEVTEVENTFSPKVRWTDTGLHGVIKRLKKGDALVTLDASHLACSITQVLELLKITAAKGVSVHFIKYRTVIKNEIPEMNSQALLNLISTIQREFVSRRTIQALERRRASGLPLGRPKGRKNKSLRLDPFKTDIERYMEIGLSKASIAKLVACHPQTLYDWLGRRAQRGVGA